MDEGKVEIYKGGNSVFTIRIKDEDGEPFDLTPYDKYSVCLPNTDGTTLTITEVAGANGSVVALLGNAILGKLQVTVKKLDAADLEEDERMDLDLVLDNASSPDPKAKRFKNVLTVIPTRCS